LSNGVAVAVRLADAARVATGQDFTHRADSAARAGAETALAALDDVLAKHGSDGARRVDATCSTRLREKGGKRQSAGGRDGTEGLGGVEFDVARAPRIALLNKSGGVQGTRKTGLAPRIASSADQSSAAALASSLATPGPSITQDG
jgi:hypothetical protein